MKQVLHHLGSGTLARADVPCPRPKPHQLLIETRASLISPGTERMLVEFGRAGWVQKARQQPDRLRQAIEKARTDGVAATWQAIQAKLDRDIPLGYANAGVVSQANAAGWRPGDRVVSNGAHAEMVTVSANLCAPIPVEVADEEAPFAVLAAIALQGIRLLGPELGERIVVTGLGLVGLLAVQLLRQAGCRVLGLDPNPARLALAEQWGVETHRLSGDARATLDHAARFTGGQGADGVLITAATASNEPVQQAAEMCRERGRIVLTGVAGLDLTRDLFYKKELSFQVSRSYGPGRYDPAYENQGHDYPRGHVRWTAQRNIAAALDLMAQGRLQVTPLISHRFAFAEAEQAYGLLASPEPSLGVVLAYAPRPEAASHKLETTVVLTRHAAVPGPRRDEDAPVVGLIGAGDYAGKVLLPELVRGGARLHTVASASGIGAAWAGRRFGFAHAASDARAILDNSAIDTVVIATRHDSHARLAAEALRQGKSVWVEKPLALDEAGLEAVTEAWLACPSPRLMVGFNRRFAPLTARLRAALPAGPREFRYTVNAGAASAGHWTLDAAEGGGRILGEACHFIDLLRYLAEAPIEALECRRSGAGAQLWIEFAGGSTGVVDYLTSGDKSFPKERLEVFASGRVVVLDNFRRLVRYPAFLNPPALGQDKGQRGAMQAFLRSVRQNEPSPLPFDEIEEVARWSLRAAAQIR